MLRNAIFNVVIINNDESSQSYLTTWAASFNNENEMYRSLATFFIKESLDEDHQVYDEETHDSIMFTLEEGLIISVIERESLATLFELHAWDERKTVEAFQKNIMKQVKNILKS